MEVILVACAVISVFSAGVSVGVLAETIHHAQRARRMESLGNVYDGELPQVVATKEPDNWKVESWRM